MVIHLTPPFDTKSLYSVEMGYEVYRRRVAAECLMMGIKLH
jgi:hypothetical protein